VLACREGISGNAKGKIGFWSKDGTSGHKEVDSIAKWAADKGLDGVIWVALKPGFRKTRGTMPTESEIIGFLRRLNGTNSESAREYICNAPAQIDTRYRKRIEQELGWLPSSVAFSACGLTQDSS
jgi:hypothetical protein